MNKSQSFVFVQVLICLANYQEFSDYLNEFMRNDPSTRYEMR